LAGRSFKKGDQNRVIWEIQKLINQKGNTIKIDGIFSEETELAIKKIQEQKQVYPSGILDEDFLKILL
jgi:peptidoglycan hydrolase-like protein with peptidoglycan-binding domain